MAEKAFRWRNSTTRRIPDADKERAIAHICARLADGSVELQWVIWHMEPRLPKPTLDDWRRARPDWNLAIDEAFEVGCCVDQMKILKIADGVQPLIYDGHTTREQRAQYRADAKRDRLRIYAMQKRIEALNRRYRPRQILEGDTDNPLIPSTFVIQPVRARHDDNDDAPVTPGHDESE